MSGAMIATWALIACTFVFSAWVGFRIAQLRADERRLNRKLKRDLAAWDHLADDDRKRALG